MLCDEARRPRPAGARPIILSVSVLALLGTVGPGGAEEAANAFAPMLDLFQPKPSETESAIDYRPRAPLVLPPSHELPAPKEAVRDPAWPKELDTEKRRRAAIDSRRPAPLSSASIEPAVTEAKIIEPAKPDEHAGECLLNSTGPRSCFDMFRGIFGGEPADTPKPGVEPTRKVLTEPPMGYRAATAVPKNADGKSSSDAATGPFDSFLQTFGLKKAND
jgi:hypothetical protein